MLVDECTDCRASLIETRLHSFDLVSGMFNTGNIFYTHQLNEISRVLVQLTELLSNRGSQLVYRLCEFFEIAGLVVL